jgi:signal transduction histidine kinase
MKSLSYNLLNAKKIDFIFKADEQLNRKKISMQNRRNFYLIFKEAINNLVKYSEATRVSINITCSDNYIKMKIQDNGIGFDMTIPSSGNGLNNMQRRTTEMNANLKIETSKGDGTTIELILKTN